MNVFITTVLAFFLCISCHHSGPGRSNSSKDAKEFKVFEVKLKPIQNPIIVNDTLRIYVQDAWIEKEWCHTKEGKIPISENHLICININKLEYYGGSENEWFIGEKPCHPHPIFETTGYYAKTNTLKLTMEEKFIPSEDTLSWDIKRIDEVQKDTFCIHKYKILGKFTLVKSYDYADLAIFSP